LLLALQPVGLRADVFVVSPDGSGDFPTIQAAIDAASDGDDIELTDGVFVGEGNRDIVIRGRDIMIRSQSDNPEACIIDCQGSAADPHRGFFIDAFTYVWLQGVTIRGGYVPDGGGAILARYTAILMVNCAIVGNVALGEGGGLRMEESDEYWTEHDIEDCVIFGNVASSGGGASIDGVPADIVGCVITGNTASGSGGGLATRDCVGLLVERSTLSGNVAMGNGGGLVNRNCITTYVTATVLWGNCAAGVGDQALLVDNDIGFHCSVVDSAGVVVTGYLGDIQYDPDCVFADPLYCDPATCEAAPTVSGDYTLDATSPALPENNVCGRLMGALGMGCSSFPVERSSWGRIKARYR
jgi:hypothetical protein